MNMPVADAQWPTAWRVDAPSFKHTCGYAFEVLSANIQNSADLAGRIRTGDPAKISHSGERESASTLLE